MATGLEMKMKRADRDEKTYKRGKGGEQRVRSMEREMYGVNEEGCNSLSPSCDDTNTESGTIGRQSITQHNTA